MLAGAMKDDRTLNTAEHALPGDTPIVRGRFGQRVSKCSDEAWALELARIRAMTPEERMLEALELHDETEELLDWIGRSRRRRRWREPCKPRERPSPSLVRLHLLRTAMLETHATSIWQLPPILSRCSGE
jgi:hypothetical protein